MLDKNIEEVPVEKLRWRCDPDQLPFETTEKIEPCDEIIGQDRALEAIVWVSILEASDTTSLLPGWPAPVVLRRLNVSWKRWRSGERSPTISAMSITSKIRHAPYAYSSCRAGECLQKEMENLIESLKKKIPLLFENETISTRRRGGRAIPK